MVGKIAQGTYKTYGHTIACNCVRRIISEVSVDGILARNNIPNNPINYQIKPATESKFKFQLHPPSDFEQQNGLPS